jgi:putative transposase
VLLRLAYLGLTNTFARLHLLPRNDRDKDIEILALRHQIAVLRRQLADTRMRVTPTDRALLAALLYRPPQQASHRIRPLVRPDTILRWHRDLIRRCHAEASRPKRPGRPPFGPSAFWFCA